MLLEDGLGSLEEAELATLDVALDEVDGAETQLACHVIDGTYPTVGRLLRFVSEQGSL